MVQMAAEWALRERQGWLAELYGTPSEPTVDTWGQVIQKRTLDSGSIQWRLVQVLQDLLESRTDPRTAAERLASLIVSHSDVGTALANTWGCVFSAIHEFSDEADLTRLADLLASLASLPDAVYRNEDTVQPRKDIESCEMKPGEKKELHWADMPDFALNLRENFNGPEADLCEGLPQRPPMEARARWRNINTFCAICIHSYSATVPALSSHINFGPWALAMALEHSPAATIGKNIALHLPAATQWIVIAGQEVYNAISKNLRAAPGDLWGGERRGRWVYGDARPFDKDRWDFWGSRFVQLAESGDFDTETTEGLWTAADRMAEISASSDEPSHND